ncbi:MAG: hypothetical protein IJU61_03515 [Victivallales bacterium]|nr:hypothetical protein [Victivallales bacterium]
MPDNRMAKAVFPARYVKAAKDYKCDGCLGEISIRKGDEIMRHKVIGPDGKFEELIFCQRCKFAIQSKIAHADGKPVVLAKGDLVEKKLARGFVKAWTTLITTLADNQRRHVDTDDNYHRAVDQFVHDAGLDKLYDSIKSKYNLAESLRQKTENRRSVVALRKSNDLLQSDNKALRDLCFDICDDFRLALDIIAQERMRLFNAKTDEERESAKASFVKALADGRELIDKFEEKTMACKGKRKGKRT